MRKLILLLALALCSCSSLPNYPTSIPTPVGPVLDILGVIL